MPLNPYAHSLSDAASESGKHQRSQPAPALSDVVATRVPGERQSASARLPSIGDVVVGGKYRIEEMLGEGGMGVVMGAEHVALVQKVALKFLAPGDTADTARFVREARATARIDSEYVARVSDIGALESGVAYMVMERLYGEDIGAYVRRAGARPIAEAVHYLLQACDAIAAAHAAGIVHRDIKPSNLFLSRRADGSYTLKVLDFGISKFFGNDPRDGVGLTRSGIVLGSPRYMSPEQVRDPKNVDTRTDVWGLGLVLYELLTGEPMYGPDPLPALCLAIVSEPPRLLRAKRPAAPAALEAVLLRCLEKAPGRRFQSVTELALALAPFAAPQSAPLLAQIAGRPGAGVAATTGQATGPSPAPLPSFVLGDDGSASGPRGANDSTPVGAAKAEPRRVRTLALVAVTTLLAFGGSFMLASGAGRDALLQRQALAARTINATRPPAEARSLAVPPLVTVDELPSAPAPTVVPIDPPPAPAEASGPATPQAPPRSAPHPKRAPQAEESLDDLNNGALLNRR